MLKMEYNTFGLITPFGYYNIIIIYIYLSSSITTSTSNKLGKGVDDDRYKTATRSRVTSMIPMARAATATTAEATTRAAAATTATAKGSAGQTLTASADALGALAARWHLALARAANTPGGRGGREDGEQRGRGHALCIMHRHMAHAHGP